jgi:hypothetical protein
MADTRPHLRASPGDIVFVPARVTAVGTDQRSLRLCVDTGIACIRLNESPHGTPRTGFVRPELVYHASNSMPSCIVEKIAMASPVSSVSEELQTLGHSKADADVMAMATPWVRSLCFTDKARIEKSASAIMSASNASMRLSLSHPTKSSWKAANPKDEGALLTDFGRMTALDRQLWENDLAPSKWPAGMIASGLVPQDGLEDYHPF